MPRMALQCWLPPHPALNTKIHQSQWCMFCKAFWRIMGFRILELVERSTP
nr:MAG TPA: hypothetical protein [Caudoviricetes sp.]